MDENEAKPEQSEEIIIESQEQTVYDRPERAMPSDEIK